MTCIWRIHGSKPYIVRWSLVYNTSAFCFSHFHLEGVGGWSEPNETNFIWKKLSHFATIPNHCSNFQKFFYSKTAWPNEQTLGGSIYGRSVMKISLFVSIKWINKHDRHHQFYFWLVNFLNFWKCQFWSFSLPEKKMAEITGISILGLKILFWFSMCFLPARICQ